MLREREALGGAAGGLRGQVGLGKSWEGGGAAGGEWEAGRAGQGAPLRQVQPGREGEVGAQAETEPPEAARACVQAEGERWRARDGKRGKKRPRRGAHREAPGGQGGRRSQEQEEAGLVGRRTVRRTPDLGEGWRERVRWIATKAINCACTNRMCIATRPCTHVHETCPLLGMLGTPSPPHAHRKPALRQALTHGEVLCTMERKSMRLSFKLAQAPHSLPRWLGDPVA